MTDNLTKKLTCTVRKLFIIMNFTRVHFLLDYERQRKEAVPRDG